MRLMDILIIYSNCQYDNIPYRVYGSRVQEAATCTVLYCTAKVQEILNFLANNNNINYRLVFRPEIVIKNLAMYVKT